MSRSFAVALARNSTGRSMTANWYVVSQEPDPPPLILMTPAESSQSEMAQRNATYQ
jgi:hypothetical protein